MKVFISWSGDRSKVVAEAFVSWLPKIIQTVDPFISSSIDKGAKWNQELSKELEETKIGIICLTSDNTRSDWLLFEAGALSKTKDAYVCTFLLDLKSSDIQYPLAQFQHTVFEKSDVRKLLAIIQNACTNIGEKVPNDTTLDDIFETFWPRFEENLLQAKGIKIDCKKTERSSDDLLGEILDNSRSTLRSNQLLEAAIWKIAQAISPNILSKHNTLTTQQENEQIMEKFRLKEIAERIVKQREEYAKGDKQKWPTSEDIRKDGQE